MLEYLLNGCFAESARAFAREVDLMNGEQGALELQGRPTLDEGGAGRAVKSNRGSAGTRNGFDDGDTQGMEGVEATPPPTSLMGPDGGAPPVSRHVTAREAIMMMDTDGGHGGKTVAFRVEKTGNDIESEEDCDCSLLSRTQLREVRLRRGASRTAVGAKVAFG